ncbi:hypothetical protein ILUMI_07018 [Ignelater luminosus]|uniref:Serpin domain-containing protein n=1 Tax=Ignelater luminosus TaxID=2038154 RepID=A0A8K0D868_IGNLU|nr:hypothetical protein ILUMI_07018 [Ignelater luminosus]
MKLLILLTFGVVLTLAVEDTVLQLFSAGNHQFTADVYKQLLKSTTGNVLVCPLSAEIILALTHAGARGETAKQMASGLHLPESSEEIQKIFTKLTQDLNSEHKYTLNSANKIYVKHDYSINQQFKDVAMNVFDAGIKNIDFSKKQEAVNEINKWVSEKTEDNIQNLVSTDDIKATTRAVLINALFFQAKWRVQFARYSTAKKPFYLNAKDHVEVDMMTMVSSFNYQEVPEVDAKILEMPYNGDDVFMTFVLPNEKEGLHRIEENLEKLFETPSFNNRTKVHVSVPKFKIQTTIKFIPILKALGIEDAFTGKADFSGIGSERLQIDQVVQKNFIAVDEEGTKAASATKVVMGLGAAPLPPAEAIFILNRPFLYYIKKDETILFAGSVKQL